MKSSILFAALLLTLPTFANPTKDAKDTAKETPKVNRAATALNKNHKLKLIHTADAQKMMASDNKPVFVDANNADTRKAQGKIPGAIELPSVSQYDLALLPTDKSKPLVFYCANEMCTASHDAAKFAIKAGYNNVTVLADGIKGWNEATKATKTN